MLNSLVSALYQLTVPRRHNGQISNHALSSMDVDRTKHWNRFRLHIMIERRRGCLVQIGGNGRREVPDKKLSAAEIISVPTAPRNEQRVILQQTSGRAVMWTWRKNCAGCRSLTATRANSLRTVHPMALLAVVWIVTHPRSVDILQFQLTDQLIKGVPLQENSSNTSQFTAANTYNTTYFVKNGVGG